MSANVTDGKQILWLIHSRSIQPTQRGESRCKLDQYCFWRSIQSVAPWIASATRMAARNDTPMPDVSINTLNVIKSREGEHAI